MKAKKNKYELSKRSKWMLGLAFFTIAFSFIAPIIFTQFSIVDFTKTGAIGDTFGGIMNPFIAIAGAILTYLAFYMQFKANKLQREQFEIQIEEDKNQFKLELSEQQVQFRKNQFENQFYEMVRLHKENVNEISITFNNVYFNGNANVRNKTEIKGRETFKYFLEEIKIIYQVAKKSYENDSPDLLINKAYGLFFHGLRFDEKIQPNNPDEKEYCDFINTMLRINIYNVNGEYKSLKHIISKYTDYKKAVNLNYEIGKGHSSYLAHYYRHLYQTVKFVGNQDENFISYNEKRKYLRILRAQLSNQEQAMLFYNWKSNFGGNWENKQNKFFTDYRMIHNIYADLLIPEFSLIKIFKLIGEPYYRMEENRKKDSLFEFEDWKEASW